MTAATAAASIAGSLPASLSLSGIGSMLAAVVVAVSGGAARTGADPQGLFTVFCWGWIAAGVLSVLVGIVQVFFPHLADGNWIAVSGLPGRAVGNLRQPNHLSSVLLWSMIAAVGLFEITRLPKALTAALMACFVFGIVLSASRTGAVAVGVLALWGVVDRRLSAFMRLLLFATLVMYLLSWMGLSAWAHAGQHAFGGEARLAEPDVSGSRFGIWANALSLIAQQPWTGVGFGEFNFAWTLTAFPGRPTAFFDHTHNLPLQLLVELGVPLGGLVLALLAYALWRSWKSSAGGDGPQGVALRCAFMMVLLSVLHSQLEYPLWYAYFLLPTAWAFGYTLAAPASKAADPAQPGIRGTTASGVSTFLVAAALAVSAGGIYAVIDYKRVVDIFDPPDNAPPLDQRIARGQRSVLFAHHAHYAAATTAEAPEQVMPAFHGAAHYLLDSRLMMAWANAYAARGELDHARYLAQRLREFRKPDTEEFFAVCSQLPAGGPKPFQCEAPTKPLTWRDFRQR